MDGKVSDEMEGTPVCEEEGLRDVKRVMPVTEGGGKRTRSAVVCPRSVPSTAAHGNN